MKTFIQFGVWIALPVLILANMLTFVSGIMLSNQISRFEQETKKVHEQNITLTTQMSRLDSLEYAASAAAALDFVKRSTPVVLENLKYALNR